MKVLMAASECAPLIKTGGLADVVGALPAALSGHGIDCRILLPAYPSLQPLLSDRRQVAQFHDLPGGFGQIVLVTFQGMDLLLLDAPQLFDRPGLPYTDPNGVDWTDNHLRFGALAQAAARVGLDGVDGWQPDIVHAHDWQTALTPVYLKQLGQAAPKSVLTIHNIAFQGRFGPHVMSELGLRGDWFHPEALEYHGDLGFLKGGLMFADRITTVSPTYAHEILTPQYGMGLEGVLQARTGILSGILNGIDTGAWNPADDPALARDYNARSLGRKAESCAKIAERVGLDPDAKGPLFCVISRLTEQKGLDALAAAVPHIVERGGQLALLGSGDPALEQAFVDASHHFSGSVGAVIGYDEAFAHLLQGGSDAILIPSRFEPCGLTQLYGLRYGTLPVVARTGGLADTVVDANVAALRAECATGFVFDDVSKVGIEAALDRVFDCFDDNKKWQMMQRAAMRQSVGWEQSALEYAELYQSLMA
ncbi:glycogen synthase GlgA [uncultured Ruegeria sp.]|uniref:glycogen synthase GlgA n=1 Tax=uncultured Ruegeria sp. TaxID=259304 RepID=UPI00260CF4AB|nr:glycogen synthase GlgA [uncultured Ruegeria sp.]